MMRSRLSLLQWNATPGSKRAAIANTVIRIVLAPVSIAIELAHLKQRIIEEEPELGIITGM